MAESFIGLPVDGIGKKLRSEELLVGAETVHQEVLTLAYANGDLVAGTLADGVLVNLGTNNDVIVTSGSIAITALPNENQQPMAGSISVAIASDQSAIPITAGSLPLPTGAATSALQLPNSHDVTVDNAGAGAAVNIQDGGNIITVDATNLDIRDLTHFSDSVQIGDGTRLATVRDTGASDSLNVSIVDATGNQIVSFGGGAAGTEYAEDTPSGAGDIGVFALTKRQDTPAADTDTDGDRARMTVDANNRLWTNGSSVTQPISAGSLPLPTGASTSANQLPDGHNVTVDNGAAGAAVNIQDGGNVITVDGTVTVAEPVTVDAVDFDIRDLTHVGDSVRIGDGTLTATVRDTGASDSLNVAIVDAAGNQVTSFGGGGTQYAEDTASAPADIGTFALAKRQDTPAADVDTDGDRARLTVDAVNRLWVNGSSVTQPISAGSLPLPTGAATAANQLPNSHDVTIDNAGAGAAVNIQDGGNVITVDGSVTVSGSVTIADLPDEDQQPMAGSISVAIASDQTPIPVSGTVSVVEPVTVEAVDLDIRDLAHATDSVTIGDGTRTATVRDTGASDSLNVAIVDAAGAQITSFGGGTQYAEDTPAGAGDTGTLALAKRQDTPAADVDTDGDRARITVDAVNRLWVNGSSVTQPVSAASLPLPTGAATAASQLPNSHDVTVDNAGAGAAVNIQDGGNVITVDGTVAVTGVSTLAEQQAQTGMLNTMDDWDNAASDGASVSGDVAHGVTDAGEPVKIGGFAVGGSSSPTSIAAGQRVRFIANQHGIPYHIGGHPNLITREYDFGASAQTDVNLAAAVVAADERVYVTRFEALNDVATTAAGVSVRAGFGTANVPTASATGVSGMIGTHPGLAPGSGIMCGTGAGVIAVGAAGEEPRFTCGAATAGNIHVVISYFLIDETP